MLCKYTNENALSSDVYSTYIYMLRFVVQHIVVF